MPHDWYDGVREIDRGQNVGADVRVAFHRLELGQRQPAGLVQDVFGDRQLPKVVEQRCRLDGSNLGFVMNAERLSEADSILLDASDVPMRHLVLRIDCLRQRFDRGEVHAVHLAKMTDLVV